MEQTLGAWLPPTQREQTLELVRARAQEFRSGRINEDTHFIDEIEQCKSDGTPLWTEVLTNFRHHANSDRLMMYGTTRDIDARKRYEQALLSAQTETERINQALKEANEELVRMAALAQQQVERERSQREDQEKLFAMLAHELKTPLATIGMLAETVQRQDGAEISRAVRDMNDVIERCIQSGQLGDNRLLPRLEACDAVALVQRAITESRWHARLDLTCEAASPPLNSDPPMLRTILDNLIDNAAKYSPRQSRIRVLTGTDSRAGIPGWTVQVINEPGTAGWPDPEQLFVKYYRAPHAHRQIGAGLGLFLIAGLARLLSGHIDYVPTSTHIRFVCWLPLDASGPSA